METTLNAIRDKGPCATGWRKLLENLGKTCADDEPLSLTTILDSNGLDDALWCLNAVVDHDKEIRLFAVWCARQVQHLVTDTRSINAVDVAERSAHGEASEGELIAARTDAWDAAWEVMSAPGSGARTADARGARTAAAWDARTAAAMAAARAARDAAMAAARGARTAAAWDAAWDTAVRSQEDKFRELISDTNRSTNKGETK